MTADRRTGQELGEELAKKIADLNSEVEDQKKTVAQAIYEATKMGIEYTQKIFQEAIV